LPAFEEPQRPERYTVSPTPEVVQELQSTLPSGAVPGRLLPADSNSLIGAVTLKAMEGILYRTGFIGAIGIIRATAAPARRKRRVDFSSDDRKHHREVILVADRASGETVSTFRVTPLNRITHWITDENSPMKPRSTILYIIGSTNRLNKSTG
jgi:DeoR/GlpR family transcriptional regulator of sugar metabolism